MVGFSPGEGYVPGLLADQPGAGGWACTTNNSPSILTVVQGSSDDHPDYMKVNLSIEHGVSPAMATVDYATKRMVPVTGVFSAGFTVRYSYLADDPEDETCIALGQDANSGWGVYLGMNKTGERTMAYHNGTDWVQIASGIADPKWYDVEILGDVAAGTFDIKVYDEEKREELDPLDDGLVAELTGLPFRDNPTSLAYVMITNDGSSKDTGAYNHSYDDLYLVPEPASLGLMCLGALALLRRRKV